MSDEKSGVLLNLPLPEEQLFRYEAADDILELLFRNPHRGFSVTQLRELTNHGGKSVDNGIKILEAANLVERTRKGRKTLVEINSGIVSKPDDPVLCVPQEEFMKPVRSFLEILEQELDSIVGVVLFGSVARGEADRSSDIDVLVVVEDDLTEMRREVHDIRQQVEERRFEGDRFEFHIMVESVEGVENYGDKMREIFSEGLVLYSTERFDEVKEAVF